MSTNKSAPPVHRLVGQIALSIDRLYRRACADYGRMPKIKRICVNPETLRILANECLDTSRLNWYSDGKGLHYLGMEVHTAPIPDGMIVLQDKDNNVVAADVCLPNDKDDRAGASPAPSPSTC